MSITAKTSLRFEIIAGCFRRYPDGREVCLDTPNGRSEYKRRVAQMVLRQHNVCGLGPHLLNGATFEHSAGRGMGAAHRDDRIIDVEGNPMNCAACYHCNGQKGSRRA